MINWPRRETYKPHIYWLGGRWAVQVSGKTRHELISPAIHWCHGR